MKIIPKTTAFLLVAILSAPLFYFFVGRPPAAEDITWGVNFSQKHASSLGLDWEEAYLAILDDLRVDNIHVAAYWDLLEPEEYRYDFEDMDWQMELAEQRGINVILAIGMKTPRWPECHIPEWAKGRSQEYQQKKILNLIEKIVTRYKDSASLFRWQVENEPFFSFGDCPWQDRKFLQQEIELVKKLDMRQRLVIISDSGEASFWFEAAKLGNIVGTTIYKKVWLKPIDSYFTYPFPPTFYWRKSLLIKRLFGKDVIAVELQAEPWGPDLLYNSPPEEQQKTMNLEQFRKNIEFAKKTGLGEFYLWGAEWWYWMKERQHQPEIWEEAKGLFSSD